MTHSRVSLLIILIITIGSLTSGCKKDVADGTSNYRHARYSVSFIIDWNANDYPTDYPSNAHFSKLIGWSHVSNSDFFKLGTYASDGIENMAELGKTNPLDEEINTKIANGEGLDLIIGSNLSGTGVGNITVEVEVDNLHPAVTLTTMLAPSPDWYLAIVNVNLLENGVFVATKTVNGLVYDAGTDNGTTYNSPNDDTFPQQPISLLENSPLGNANNTQPIAQIVFTKLN